MRRRSPLVLLIPAALGASVPVAVAGAAETPRGPAPAESAAPQQRDGGITLVRQTPWVAPEGSAEFVLDVDEPDGPTEVRVTVHRAVTSRVALRQALSGERLGRIEGRLTVPARELAETVENGRRTLNLSVEGTDPDPQRLVPGRSGVYPVEIDLLGRNGPIDGFVTPLVVLAPGVVPLTVSWIWPLDATPAHHPDGTIRPEAVRAVGPGGRLGRLVGAAAEFGDVPLTLAPTPETLEAWAELSESRPGSGAADTLATAKSVLPAVATGDARQVLAGSYVPVDVPATLAGDLDTEVDDQFFQGPAALAAVLGPGLSPATVLASTLDIPALARLRLYGTERLVVAPSTLEPVDQRLTPSRPFLLAGRGKPVAAAVEDPDLASLLEGDDPPGLQAARFLAALSLVALEAPGEARGVVVVSSAEWKPPARLLDSVLSALRNHPALAPATIDQFFTTVPIETGPDGAAVERSLREVEPPPASVMSQRIARLRNALAAFTEVVAADQSVAKAADRSILIAQSDRLPETGPTSSNAYLVGADRLMSDLTGRVRGPDGQRVTITARKATIPISLLNPNPHPLNVKVRLESDQLFFPDGAERLITLPPENTTQNFKVETRASGAFPLTILVTSPDGLLEVNRSQLTVRSTVVSGVGALLTAGAGLFLVLWWANDLRRSRRNGGRRVRRSRLAVTGVAVPTE